MEEFEILEYFNLPFNVLGLVEVSVEWCLIS